jgi:hypothetical protein
MQRHSARAWAQPDSKQPAGMGLWDCYCVACGRYVTSYNGASVPPSFACSSCQRLADLARGVLTAQDPPSGGGHPPAR